MRTFPFAPLVALAVTVILPTGAAPTTADAPSPAGTLRAGLDLPSYLSGLVPAAPSQVPTLDQSQYHAPVPRDGRTEGLAPKSSNLAIKRHMTGTLGNAKKRSTNVKKPHSAQRPSKSDALQRSSRPQSQPSNANADSSPALLSALQPHTDPASSPQVELPSEGAVESEGTQAPEELSAAPQDPPHTHGSSSPFPIASSLFQSSGKTREATSQSITSVTGSAPKEQPAAGATTDYRERTAGAQVPGAAPVYGKSAEKVQASASPESPVKGVRKSETTPPTTPQRRTLIQDELDNLTNGHSIEASTNPILPEPGKDGRKGVANIDSNRQPDSKGAASPGQAALADPPTKEAERASVSTVASSNQVSGKNRQVEPTVPNGPTRQAAEKVAVEPAAPRTPTPPQ